MGRHWLTGRHPYDIGIGRLVAFPNLMSLLVIRFNVCRVYHCGQGCPDGPVAIDGPKTSVGSWDEGPFKVAKKAWRNSANICRNPRV
jgi:hypothetical protein